MGWVVNATPRPLYPQERDPLPIVQEVGWAPGPAWTGARGDDINPLYLLFKLCNGLVHWMLIAVITNISAVPF
jgi:hypothetical protein